MLRLFRTQVGEALLPDFRSVQVGCRSKVRQLSSVTYVSLQHTSLRDLLKLIVSDKTPNIPCGWFALSA
jgi:hypothetical protein